MPRKRILMIVEAMGGGVFSYLTDLSNGLARDFEVYIVYAVREQTPERPETYFDGCVKLIRAEHLTRSISPAKDCAALRELRRLAQEIQPDIIHLHSSKAGALGRLAFSGRKVPLFYTPHGYSFLMRDCSPVKRRIYWSIEKACAWRNCTTVSCGAGEHQESLKLGARAVCIANGIDTKALDGWLANAPKKKDSSFTVATLGRICEQKNPALFNRIALKLPRVKFLWIGDGELRSELTAPNIEVTGWLSRGDALAHAMGSDMFMLTSLWEGLPIALLEAMYMQKPCAVSDVHGSRDVISDGENGYLCRTLDEYVCAIRKSQENQSEALAERAHEDICGRYSLEIMLEQYRALYRNALNNK